MTRQPHVRPLYPPDDLGQQGWGEPTPDTLARDLLGLAAVIAIAVVLLILVPVLAGGPS